MKRFWPSNDEKALLAQESQWRVHLAVSKAEIGVPGLPNFGEHVQSFEDLLADARRDAWRRRIAWVGAGAIALLVLLAGGYAMTLDKSCGPANPFARDCPRP